MKMLKYNYELIRDESDTELTDKRLKIRKFTPTFPTELTDISSLRGRNSTGKSTLLHIIALGLYGLKNKNIHKSLNEKMEALIHSNYQNLVFNFVIENTQNSIKIVSKKQYPDSEEIKVYEIDKNGKEISLSFETFSNKYKLIYDIPNNPIGRLNDLISELDFRQRILGNQVMQLNSGIRNVIQDIKNSKDPKKIKEFENRKNELSSVIEEDVKLYEKLDKELSLFKRYTYFKYYVEYRDKKFKADNKLKKLEKQRVDNIKEVKRQEKTQEEIFKKGLGYINEIIGNINELAYFIKKNIGKEEKRLYHICNLEKLNIKKTMLDEDRNEVIIGALEYYEDLFKNEKSNLSSSDKYLEAYMYKQLIEILKDHINLDVVIPGVGKNINDFIKILKKEYKKYEGLGIEKENIEKIMYLIDDTKSRRKYFINNFTKRMKEYIKESTDIEAYKLTEEELNIINLNKLRDDLNYYEEKTNLYHDKIIRINEKCEYIPVKNRLNKLKDNQIIQDYLNWEEEQLEKKIKDLEEELKEENQEIEYNRARLNNYNRDLKLLDSKEEHKYITDHDFLNDLFEVTRKLSGVILNDFTDYLEIIRKKKKNIENELYQKYVKQVSKYLAKKVGTIKYIDGSNLSVESINLVNGEIRVKDGRVIRLNDLGVGHSQAAYLKGVLNSSDNKKIIALIDETAMMDNETLETIIDKMRDLYKEGKLLLGLIVRQDEFEKVESLI
jgi:exonuclease SbcC